MNNNQKNQSKYLVQKILIIFLIALMFVLAFVDFQLFNHAKDETIVMNALLRFLGGFIIILIMINVGYSKMFKFNHIGKSLLIVIPAFIISINNFPIIAFLDGRANLIDPVYRVYLFLIECLSVGFFEEIIFRGFLLVFLLKQLSHLKNGVFISIVLSSLIFGFIHIFNIFSGSSITDTITQIGYSFLVGMLWAVMYIKTKNLWVVMLLHASYNFFGQVMFYLGNVNNRYDTLTIIITVLFAVIAAIYAFILYRRIEHKELAPFFN